MTIKSTVFFADTLQEHTLQLKSVLSQDYYCFVSHEAEEFNQAFQQSGKFVLIFSNAQKALQLLDAGAFFLNGLTFKIYLYLDRKGNFKPDAQKILNSRNINIFQIDERTQLISSMKSFFNESDIENFEDLQFYKPED